jgi:predicted O-methyltransferase YrrM
VVFVEGESKRTVPAHSFDGPLDLVLLDGPHAYPLPQLEFAYLSPHIRPGGWIVLDDIQIPSVHELVHFMRRESSMVLEEVAVRTAFFRKIRECDFGPDGWQHQGMNRRTVLRYSWRDRLRRFLPGRRS